MHRALQVAPVRKPAPRATPHYQPLCVVCAVVAAGIVVDRYHSIRLGSWLAPAVAAWIGWLLAYRRERNRTAAALLLLSCGCTAGAWHHCRWSSFSADDVGRFAAAGPTGVALEATVCDAPRNIEPVSSSRGDDPFAPPGGYSSDQEPRTRFEIAALRIRDGERWIAASGRADVQLQGRLEGVAAGDVIRIFGTLTPIAPPLNPGEFDFAEHYRADRKLCTVRVAGPAGVSVVEARSPWDVWARFSEWRRAAQRRLLADVSREQAGFASALLLGYRDLLARRDNRSFFRTGTVHVLSISGLHIGMLALFLHGALRFGWLRRTTAIGVIAGVTAGYALLIDAEPPAVRAVIVVLLAAVGALLGRRALSFNLLAASALLVLAVNPCDLFRTGPQLSFLAAAVLAWQAELRFRQEPREIDPLTQLGKPAWRRWCERRARLFGRALIVSSLIFLITTPLVAHRFHIVSPISLLLTPLLALPVALALFTGFLTFTVGWLVPPLGTACGAFCSGMLTLIDACVAGTQFWPGAAFWLPGPTLTQTIVFYVLAAAWMALPAASRVGRRVLCGAACVWCAATMIPRHDLPADTALRTTFIAVGHGLSVLVEPSDAEPWLYDCGRMHAPESAARSISAVLWSRGIARLDAVVISHGDADHYNALPYVLEQFRPRKIVISTSMAQVDDEAFRYVSDVARQAGVPIVAVAAGDRLPVSSASSEPVVLHPSPNGGPSANDNAESLVVELAAAGARVLLTGDVEGPGLKRLLAEPTRECDVVLAPHHGSANSNPPGLASWARPKLVVVSGEADAAGATAHAYESAGAQLRTTTHDGAVAAIISRDGRLTFAAFRESFSKSPE